MITYSSVCDPIKITLSGKSQFKKRFDINRTYMASLKSENLLQNFLIEAALKTWNHKPGDDFHWGWESPECQLRGHFPGHWLSAAARLFAQTGDQEIKGKADYIVSKLAVCQIENGGQWVGTIPEKYLYFIARGKEVWAPHYTIHKTFMGLVDMAKFAASQKALEVADLWADWFLNWTEGFSRKEMDDILGVETGGMLEVWADLYGLTGSDKYLKLMERYDRPRLFDKLLAGEDPLTEKHANTTIPEIHGAARAYEVTGNERYRRIVEAYWNQAVTERGYFATGGQTNKEVWTPKQNLAGQLSPTNQEHCVVYNMIRLADFLFRWTGDISYHDYIERNIYNGLFAQQNMSNGMVTYHLPLHAGSVKVWGTPTHDFWCCHGTLVQAHTLYSDLAFYSKGRDIVLCQFIQGSVKKTVDHAEVQISQEGQFNLIHENRIRVSVKASEACRFSLNVRIPWWVEDYTLSVNGQVQKLKRDVSNGMLEIEREWSDDKIELVFPKNVYTCPLPGEPGLKAFMHGPVVLAGLCDEEKLVVTDGIPIDELFRPSDENGWEGGSFYLTGQQEGIKFLPLYSIDKQKYTVYFPVK